MREGTFQAKMTMLEAKADRVQEPMSSKNGDESTTSTNKTSMPYTIKVKKA